MSTEIEEEKAKAEAKVEAPAAAVSPDDAAIGKNRHERRKEAAIGEKIEVKSNVHVGEMPKVEKTPLTHAELLELQEMQRMVNHRSFEAKQVAGNTALIPRGQEVAKELDALARLLDNSRNQWISQKLREHGYPQDAMCQVNLETGEIIWTNEPKPAEKAPEKAPE